MLERISGLQDGLAILISGARGHNTAAIGFTQGFNRRSAYTALLWGVQDPIDLILTAPHPTV
jgi:hypothetical protein